MTRFLFLTWDGGGNQPPAIGIAQELREHGNEVLFAGYASQQSRFTARGFRFVLLERSQAALEAASGDGWTRLRDGVLLCTPQLEEVPELCAREQADVVVVDCMMLAALLACEVTRLPTAVFVHSPPGAILHPGRVLGQRLPSPLNALRVTAGLPAVERLWDGWRGMLVVCTSIPQLDPLLGEIPSEFAFVGPVFERVPPSDWHSPWSVDDSRPLILASFSTHVSQNQRSRIQRTLMGLAHLPYRILVTSGRTDLSGIEVPANAVIVEYVPHSEVLPEVAAAVTHAGHGTIVASLAHWVPLVCLPNPIIADQVPLAAQVERLGAGRALDGESATPADIAAAVVEVLTHPTYRSAARELAGVIAERPGAATAASRLMRFAGQTPSRSYPQAGR